MGHSANTSVRLAGTTDVVVIGAGHAGLAASHCLTGLGIEHVVLERGEVANSWRNERWDSLRLLTPNWQCQLPGYRYDGNDPDGYMDMAELIRFMQNYADASNAPLRTNTTVLSVRQNDKGYRVETTRGLWQSRAVVIASGACNRASVPGLAADVPQDIVQLTAHDYRNAAQLPAGDVLVVGASATGLQFADEIRRAGHNVTIATGEHVRLPRTYRGRDILAWMHDGGILDECYDEVDDLGRARNLPSAQLVGTRDYDILDLNRLQDSGVRVVGRLMGINGSNAQFSGSLQNVCALADLKMNRLLDSIDEFVVDHAIDCEPKRRFAATRVDESPQLMMPLGGDAISTIVWATGFKPDYSWLDVPVLDRKGRLRHDGGIVDAPGLYALGLPMMRRRKSSFIFGISDDARDITTHLAGWLAGPGIHQRATPAWASAGAGRRRA